MRTPFWTHFAMPTIAPAALTVSRKRAVNLTLNENLVAQAKTFTGNLSATMEQLLEAFVVQQSQLHAARRQDADDCAHDWNAVHDKIGSFADEHSTL